MLQFGFFPSSVFKITRNILRVGETSVRFLRKKRNMSCFQKLVLVILIESTDKVLTARNSESDSLLPESYELSFFFTFVQSVTEVHKSQTPDRPSDQILYGGA
jgi:hypothetical protein